MTLSKEEIKIKTTAMAYARIIRNTIAKRETNLEIFPAVDIPASIFMAGSPGSGKTEAAKILITKMGGGVIRIDADKYRPEFPAYRGDNSYLFQSAVNEIVHSVHDMALKQQQNFLLDGTLAHYETAKSDINSSLKSNRDVQIIYVYQDPLLAWEFVQAREEVEGRMVPLESFIERYFMARENVNNLKIHFGSDVRVDLLIRNFDNLHHDYKKDVKSVDEHIPEPYSYETLECLLAPDPRGV